MCTCFPQRSLLDTEFPTYRKKRDSNPSRDYYSSNTTSHNYPRSRSRSRSRSHTHSHSHHTRDASRFTARAHSHSRSAMHYHSSTPSHFLADRPPSPLVQSRSVSPSDSRSRSRSISPSRSNSRSRSVSPSNSSLMNPAASFQASRVHDKERAPLTLEYLRSHPAEPGTREWRSQVSCL